MKDFLCGAGSLALLAFAIIIPAHAQSYSEPSNAQDLASQDPGSQKQAATDTASNIPATSTTDQAEGSASKTNESITSTEASLSTGSSAQTTNKTVTSQSPAVNNRVIEEIVVTAEKRSENIQDVPIAIAAFSSEALDARGAYDTKALATLSPGITTSQFGGYSFIYIRGVGSDAFVPSADPSVTTYVDGVFVPTSQGFSTDFGGIERVEILKGPQGTLFGRNSTGGAISIITKKPGDQLSGDLQGEVGNYNEKRLKGYFNIPITSTLAASVDLLYKYLDNQYTEVNRGVTPTKDLFGRFRLDWHPTTYLDFDFSYYKSRQESGDLLAINIAPSPLGSALLIQPQPDGYKANTDYPGLIRGGSYVYALNSTLNLPWFDVKLIGSWQDAKSDITSYDFDGSPLPLVSFYTYGQLARSQSAEAQIASRPDGWGGRKFEWIVGGYYLLSEGGYPALVLIPGTNLVNYAYNNLSLPASVRSILAPIIPTLNKDVNINVLNSGLVRARSLSGFTQETWHTTDWLSLTVGGRFQRENRNQLVTDSAVYIPATETYSTLFNYPHQSKTRNDFATRLSVNLQPTEGQLIYFSRSQSFKSATYNIFNLYTPAQYVLPEQDVTYEVGTKSDFFGHLVRLNTAIFDNIVKNRQVAFVSLLSGGAAVLSNAPRAQIEGAEFDITAVPISKLDPGLALTANGSYLYGTYKNYPNGSGYSQSTGLYEPTVDFTGKQVERTPRFSGDIGLIQTIEAGESGEVEIGSDVYYTSGFYYSPENKSNYKENAYKLVNAHGSYLYQPEHIRFTMFAKNIFNAHYHEGLFETDFGTLSTIAYKCQFGGMIDWSF